MKPFRFTVDPKQDKIIAQIIAILLWVESNEGFYALLHRGEQNYQGYLADSELWALRDLLWSLVEKWPDSHFLIDLSQWKYPLDALFELDSAIRRVAKCRSRRERLSERFIALTYDDRWTQRYAQAFEAWNAARVPQELLRVQASSQNWSSLGSIWDEVVVA